ncbi:MurR/RpiR family transcriptional regulator [Methylopila sp. 73B]|uniref:MurR/RpiR family transcriptional regulator n=1 Tax=Methylopila sp. 73B TaxID=1120792 RepID=UPI000371393F|nr:MurR/RpiR family transcriptional regulator [Methylopila sp. 73B]
MTSHPHLAALIRDRYADLSPAERKLADVLNEFPGEIAAYTASELAKVAGVSNAAVTRLARRLGLDGYEEMRRIAREERQAGSPLFLLARDEAGAPSPAARHRDASLANVGGAFERLDETALNAAAEALAAAPRMWIAGFRSGAAFAAHLRWQLIQFRPDVHLLAGAGETLGETVASIGTGDVVAVFGLRRRTPAVRPIVRAARDAGASVLLIADHGVGPDDDLASWTFRCTTRSEGPLDNYVGVLALCHALAGAVIARLEAQGRRRLARIEHLHLSLEEL